MNEGGGGHSGSEDGNQKVEVREWAAGKNSGHLADKHRDKMRVLSQNEIMLLIKLRIIGEACLDGMMRLSMLNLTFTRSIK